jgi:hypothetical protein
VARSSTLAIDPAGRLLVAGVIHYPDEAWLAKFAPDGAPDWEKRFVLGHLTAAYAVGFDRVGDIYAAGSRIGPDGKSTDWWIKKFSPDGREILEWNKTVRGKNLGGARFTLRIGARDEIYILGSGSGWASRTPRSNAGGLRTPSVGAVRFLSTTVSLLIDTACPANYSVDTLKIARTPLCRLLHCESTGRIPT